MVGGNTNTLRRQFSQPTRTKTKHTLQAGKEARQLDVTSWGAFEGSARVVSCLQLCSLILFGAAGARRASFA